MFEVMAYEARTVSWWNDQRDNIDLNPPYQRRGQLWSERDKEFLIDSILNGYDVPKIYIADFTFFGISVLRRNNKQYAVIDGKQRLGAIFDFFDNRLKLAQDFVWEGDPSFRLGGLSYKDLFRNFPKVASKFANFNLAVMRVVTDDEAKINELFVRLNRSKPLTGAEVRNAMGGVVPEIIRSITEHRFFSEAVRFSTRRRQDSNAAAKLLLLEFRGRPVGTQKPNMDRFVMEGKSAQAGAEEFERAGDRVLAVLNRMVQIFTPRDPLLSSAGPLAVYYWFVRETEPASDPRIRPFLQNFRETMAENRRAAASQNLSVDPELVQYEHFDRSTDNQGAIEGRHEILRRRFAMFLN